MTYSKILLVTLCAILLMTPAMAQERYINFTSLTSKEGLSSNTVNAILKDSYGLVWFATEDGLDRFDGLNIKVYRHKRGNTETLQSNEILSLHEDKAGNLWVGTSGGSLSLYDRKKDAFINFPSNTTGNAISNNVILSICSDYKGNIWIANYSGVNILDSATRRITKLPDVPDSLKSAFLQGVNILFEDKSHRMWIGTNHGLYQYNPKNQTCRRFFQNENDIYGLSNDNINAIAEDEKGNLWIGTSNGLNILPSGTSTIFNYRKYNDKVLINNFIYAISISGDTLWIGTSEGLNLLNTSTNEISTYSLDHRDIHSLTAHSVRCIYIDNLGIYWLGTSGGGVDKYNKNLNLFNYVQSNFFDEKGLHSSIVTSFAEDKNGHIYVGTQGGGLSIFNRDTRLFQHLHIQTKLNNTGAPISIIALKMTSRNRLMIGSYADGLFVYDPALETYKQFYKGAKEEDLNSNYIFCFEEDSKGNIWIGTNGEGIIVMSPENKVIARYTPNPKDANDIKLPINGFIRDIKEDHDGNIWIATHGGGLAMLQTSSGKFSIYNSGNTNLTNDKVLSLLLDKKGDVWAATFGGGIGLLDKTTKQFTNFSEKDGLQNNSIYKILEDKNGLIWVSTNIGISSIDAVTKRIKNYNYHNGVQNNNFVYGAGLCMSNGEVFFGGLEGFNYFNPAYLKKNNNKPPVLITELKISNQLIEPGENGPIQENISLANQINLDYKQNFTLSFVGVSYTSPEQNQYAYKLEGFENNWNYVGNSTTASYTNLDPGRYVFRVKASNNDGVWNKESTSIIIYVHPPIWRTIYAYVFYVLLIAGSILYLRHRGIQKLKRKFALTQEKNKAEQDRKEIEKIHELDELKIKFLTNLSHEFRTPISLILGPLENLLGKEKDERSVGQLYMIKRNASRLLNLVNQLLDFRKMEEHELKLHASEGEFVAFLKDVCDSFVDLSERKKIDFYFTSQFSELHTVFDHEKIERILFNVLSNAFKFTLEGGKIGVELEKQINMPDQTNTWVNIKVTDTGVGIPEDKKEKIFERFFQTATAASVLNQGTGIGLSIAREFVKMHGGIIDVESKADVGTIFNIRIPLPVLDVSNNVNRQLQPAAITNGEPDMEKTLPVEGHSDTSSKDILSVLLVEDNEDFRSYLRDNLQLHYKVYEASNGKEGWQTALLKHPDLIVSDISMPYMDGIELSGKIKSDKRTNHIPIILLTALTGEEDQIKGLETGATDYITKPFNFEVLNAKIKNLLVLNNTLKNTYSKQIKVVAPEIEIESDDQKLLNKIMLYLEDNLTNPKLSVEELSRQVGMSRSSLYSKLLEITGQTPVEYIRSVKLDKAAVLLEKSDMYVSEVAYTVGFATPKYFAKSFKEKFGMLPSEYIYKKRNDKT